MDVLAAEIFRIPPSERLRRLYALVDLDPFRRLTPTAQSYRAALQACLEALHARTLDVARAEATAAYWRRQATERAS